MVPSSSSTTTSKAGAKADLDVIVRKRRYNGKTRKWSEWTIEFRRSQWNDPVSCSTRRATQKSEPPNMFPLPLGGTFKIYPNLMSEKVQMELTDELHQFGHWFRQYRIQGGPEPRAHFLLHHHATDDESAPQPGYKYSSITMKAKPLRSLDKLRKFSIKMAKQFCGVPKWNIGVNPVYYRDGRDHMGFHADDDQGEKMILTCLVRSPSEPRRVIIQTAPRKGTKKKQDGDEQYELTLGAGDAYDMDKEMQKHYVHGVPNSRDDNAPTSERIAIVFRHGDDATYSVDSGEPLESLKPRAVIPLTFGRMDGLVEGQSYSRSQIREIGAHRSPQGGISGNVKAGCDAIVVTGARPDGLGDDCLEKLVYAAESKVGAGGILTSLKENKPVRVFRSSANPKNKYRALPLAKGPAQYRYDGVYRVVSVTFFNDETGIPIRETSRDKVSPIQLGQIYQFQFERIQAGNDAHTNQTTTQELVKASIRNNTLARDAIPCGRLEFPTPKVKQLIGNRVVSPPIQETAVHRNTSSSPLPVDHPSRVSPSISDTLVVSTLEGIDPFEDVYFDEHLVHNFGCFPTPAFGDDCDNIALLARHASHPARPSSTCNHETLTEPWRVLDVPDFPRHPYYVDEANLLLHFTSFESPHEPATSEVPLVQRDSRSGTTMPPLPWYGACQHNSPPGGGIGNDEFDGRFLSAGSSTLHGNHLFDAGRGLLDKSSVLIKVDEADLLLHFARS